MSANPAPPCVMVIFGASGDLTQRKLIPALYHLERDGLLSESFAVIGMSREPMTHEAFRNRLSDRIQGFLGSEKLNTEVWSRLVNKLYYHPGAGQDPKAYEGLKTLYDEVSRSHKTGGNGVFYLATPPSLFGPIVGQLGQCGLSQEKEGEGYRRVVIEKPFGKKRARISTSAFFQARKISLFRAPSFSREKSSKQSPKEGALRCSYRGAILLFRFFGDCPSSRSLGKKWSFFGGMSEWYFLTPLRAII